MLSPASAVGGYLPVQLQHDLHQYINHEHTGSVLHSYSHRIALCRGSRTILENMYNWTRTEPALMFAAVISLRALH